MQNDYLESFACTTVGRVRRNNEDAALMLREQRIFVVADGIGGGNAGEVASSMTIAEIEKHVLQAKLRPAELEAAIIRSIYSANQNIADYGSLHQYKSMGTTVACLFFNPWQPTQARVMHAGDSRIYRFRHKGQLCHLFKLDLKQLTTDHSKKPGSNVILNNVGKGPGFFLDSSTADVHNGDLFIVCSDGLSHMLSDREISCICMNGMQSDTKTICMDLVNRALRNGGRDNITVIVIRVNDLPEAYAPSEEEIAEEQEIHKKNNQVLTETP